MKATMIKLITAVTKSPHFTATASVTIFPAASSTAGFRTYIFLERSAPPIIPMSGDTTPSVKEVITLPKAPPITNATAMSTRLPFMAKSLNSFKNPIISGLKFLKTSIKVKKYFVK